MATHPTGLRVRAARILAGYDNLKDFAEALNYKNLGTRTLRKVEAGTRDLEEHEMFAISIFTEIAPAFFEGDLDKLRIDRGPAVSIPEGAMATEAVRDALSQLIRAVGQANGLTLGGTQSPPADADHPEPGAAGDAA